jgi:hypothetical protein
MGVESACSDGRRFAACRGDAFGHFGLERADEEWAALPALVVTALARTDITAQTGTTQ